MCTCVKQKSMAQTRTFSAYSIFIFSSTQCIYAIYYETNYKTERKKRKIYDDMMTLKISPKQFINSNIKLLYSNSVLEKHSKQSDNLKNIRQSVCIDRLYSTAVT